MYMCMYTHILYTDVSLYACNISWAETQDARHRPWTHCPKPKTLGAKYPSPKTGYPVCIIVGLYKHQKVKGHLLSP